ncbi:MAG: methyltransferase domain-containing protein [Acidobacteriales bacterium]|nr:methyltransferase domain-containing protein [Terriglobales bacterium]
MNLWQSKYLVQKAISFLPFDWGLRANHFLSLHFGGLRHPVLWGYPKTMEMLWLLEQEGFHPKDSVCVEVGTGWDGSSALTLTARGAAKVHTFDLHRHLEPRLWQLAVATVAEKKPVNVDHLPFSPPWDELRGLLTAPVPERVAYQAPADARHTGLPDASVDLCYSHAVLEHIPVAILREIHAETLRILKPGGFVYHYAQPAMHGRKGSTSIDYLTVSSATWERWLANSIAYENRLRAKQQVELLADAGFEVVRSWTTSDPEGREKLRTMQIAPEFKKFTPEELTQNFVWIIARKP